MNIDVQLDKARSIGIHIYIHMCGGKALHFAVISSANYILLSNEDRLSSMIPEILNELARYIK